MISFRFILALGTLVLLPFLARAEAPDQSDAIIRGRYQAILGDCAACHTKPGGRPFAGGNPLQTPFGAIVPPNITSDRETGIGDWTYDEFVRMMRTGVGRGGKRLYPAMPYPAYSLMTDEDLSDLWAYLNTVEPVSNLVIANQLPFPFNIRFGMWFWNLLSFSSEPYRPDPSQSAEWNRGAYIVLGPGHCGACHTPKTLIGGDKPSEQLKGFSLQGWYAPDITGDTHAGVGTWSREELVAYLKTGVNKHTIASGPMAEAVENSTSQMTQEDLSAVATYLQSLRSGEPAKTLPLTADDPRMRSGAAIYRDNCAACHESQGGGAARLFPALAGSPIVQQQNTETLAHLVIAGSQGVFTENAPTAPSMPSLGWRLDNREIADVLTYVRNSWGNSASAVDPADVALVRKMGQAHQAIEWPWFAAMAIGAVLVLMLLAFGIFRLWTRRVKSA